MESRHDKLRMRYGTFQAFSPLMAGATSYQINSISVRAGWKPCRPYPAGTCTGWFIWSFSATPERC